MLAGPHATSGLATTKKSVSEPSSATARLTAPPYPRLPPVRSSRVLGWSANAASGLPSVEPLSAITTLTGRSVACASVARNRCRCGPGENVTVTTVRLSLTALRVAVDHLEVRQPQGTANHAR